MILELTVLSSYANGSPNLTGSSLKLTDEVTSATEIVVGKFTKIGNGASFTLSGRRYRGQVALSEILKGTVFDSSDIAFTVGIQSKEVVPNLEDTYIVFIHNHRIKKLLPASDDNIAKVKALIAAAPLGK